MKNVQEMSKVEFDSVTGLYLVKLLSAATGIWIIAAECETEQQAKIDQKMLAQ